MSLQNVVFPSSIRSIGEKAFQGCGNLTDINFPEGLETIGKDGFVKQVNEVLKDDSKVYGYTDTMKLVNIAGDENLIGKIIPVKITDAKSFSLDGEYSQG